LGAVWEITALVSFFNFSGRLEAAPGLPPAEIPEGVWHIVEGMTTISHAGER
jgi:hypothetical protein